MATVVIDARSLLLQEQTAKSLRIISINKTQASRVEIFSSYNKTREEIEKNKTRGCDNSTLRRRRVTNCSLAERSFSKRNTFTEQHLMQREVEPTIPRSTRWTRGANNINLLTLGHVRLMFGF